MSVTDVVPQRRSPGIQIVSYLVLLYAVFGFYNQNYLGWISSPWFSAYSERIAIIVFGVLRICTERNAYTRRRLAFLVGAVGLLWLVLPLFFNITFFNQHIFGTPWFYAYLLIIFFFGRRADCSWNCPCVGIRDTAGEAFRDRTVKSSWDRVLNTLKWVALASALPYLWLVLIDPAARWANIYQLGFWTVHLNLYFISLVVIPFTGNRNYCRYLCPWGALYGLVGRLGFFHVVADRDKCIPCNQCEKSCDMGVPIRRLVQDKGEIKTADCVGCGRCVQSCPRGALRLEDGRGWLKRWLGRWKKAAA